MMRVLLSVLTFILCLASTAPAAWALEVLDLRFGQHPDKIRSVMEISEPSDFRAFMLADPYRLVIDMPSFDWKVGDLGAITDYGLKAVRTGQLDRKTSRVVYELQSPVTIENAFIMPKSGSNPDRLVIDFAKADAQSFAAHKDKVFGELSAQSKQATATTYNPSGTVTPQSKPPADPPRRNSKPLIILDPGHGGADPGAPGKAGKHEKHVVLLLAKELKTQLESTGRYRVKMTRSDDRFIRLRDRVNFARKHDADLFMSIHADSINKPHIRGASVYTLSEKASDEQTARLAARENRSDIIAGVDLEVEDEEVANILVDLAMRDTMNQSNFFAGRLVENFQARSIRLLENPHRSAGFAVLKAPDIPSVLVEAGFMSNRTEAQMLTRADYRRRIAGALKDGINAYFAKVRQNERG